MRYAQWWLRQFGLRWRYATREPYDLEANHALLAEIDRHYDESIPPVLECAP